MLLTEAIDRIEKLYDEISEILQDPNATPEIVDKAAEIIHRLNNMVDRLEQQIPGEN